ncbi:MAG: hypothetical protein H6841_06220 [Planctomycetes bacterium]|nr:hypothetical protein [Planctomycetota bacterium]
MVTERQEQAAIDLAVQLLQEHLGLEGRRASVEFVSDPHSRHDAMVSLGPVVFAVEHKSTSYSGMLIHAIDDVTIAANEARALGQHVVPLIVVPYMGEVGRDLCKKANVSWLDLSGNARISVTRDQISDISIINNVNNVINVNIQCKPNSFKRRGRPRDLSSPVTSRLVRWFLLHVNHQYKPHEIEQDMADEQLRLLRMAKPRQEAFVKATSASEGTVSKVVNRLIRDGEVARDKEGRLRVVDPAALLDSWRESYDIYKHRVIKGAVFSRSGPELMRVLSGKLTDAGVDHAMTGLAGAWLYDHFASFRTVSLYLHERPTDELLAAIGFKEDEKAANVWLVLPNDLGVFDGGRTLKGIPVVNQIQVYLDLKSHAERAEEAAEHLRANHLNWSRHG